MEISLLLAKLSEYIKWNKARLNFLANFLIALIKVKTINLTQIATCFAGKAKIESSYRRIQRFFQTYTIDFVLVAKLIAKMLNIAENTGCTLAMDRTNWKFGKMSINILMLGVVYKGIAFPILWTLLPKKGNSNTKERCDLMDLFRNIFATIQVQCVLADREFIGERWFSYLLSSAPSIPFRIRIRSNILVSNSRGIPVKAGQLFHHLKVGQYEILNRQRVIFGKSLFVVGLRLMSPSNGLLIIVTDCKPETALKDYQKRWQIETFFACCKTRGFCLEDTHLVHPERIKKLIALLAIAFAWAHVIGEFRDSTEPIPIKSHGRKAVSLFRYGFDFLRHCLLVPDIHYSFLQSFVSLLFQKHCFI